MGSALRALVTKGEKGQPLGGKGGSTQNLIQKVDELFWMGEYSVLSNIRPNSSLFVIRFDPNAGIRYFRIIRCSRIGS